MFTFYMYGVWAEPACVSSASHMQWQQWTVADTTLIFWTSFHMAIFLTRMRIADSVTQRVENLRWLDRIFE